MFTDDGNENAAALLCGSAKTESEQRLLVRKIIPATQSEYTERMSYHLEVAPSYYNRVVDAALKEDLNVIIVHSHPFSGPAHYSMSDDYGESRLLPVLESLIPGREVASMLVSHTSANGRRYKGNEFIDFNSLTIVGQRTETISFKDEKSEKDKDQGFFDRQIRVFGTGGQKILCDLKVAIVGTGGTGSIVAEQLTRAGVKDIVLVDPEDVEKSNVSRLFGANRKDVGSEKAAVVAAHLRRIGAKKVLTIIDSATRQETLLLLRDRDIVFSCVDNDLSRSILNRFAHQYVIPLIDMGIRLDGRTGDIVRAAGRVSVVGPSMTCLRCSGNINSERIHAESIPKAERRDLEREGYIIGIDESVPSVISLNATVGGLAVTAAINIFVNLTGGAQPLNQLYDATDGIIFIADDKHEPGCDICDENGGVKALGDKQIVSAYD